MDVSKAEKTQKEPFREPFLPTSGPVSQWFPGKNVAGRILAPVYSK